MRISNNADISLPLAVWLVHDEYDYVDKKNYISVTTLMKPLKQIILPSRIPVADRHSDVEDYIARKLGNAIHDSIERAWTHGHSRALQLLGYPEDVIRRIVVNPVTEQLRTIKDIIPVYLEQRAFREIVIDGVTYTVGGKYDMVADGILSDNKSTSAYGWVYGTKNDDHARQMSLYRWIDAGQEQPRITEDFGNVNYVFTDWQKALAKSNPNYPNKRVEQTRLELLSLDETEAYVRAKLTAVARNQNMPEAKMPECTDEELWRSAPKYKYFSKVENVKASKTFDNLADANKHVAEMGKGFIKTVPGEVKACGYCAAFDACKQKDQYFADA